MNSIQPGVVSAILNSLGVQAPIEAKAKVPPKGPSTDDTVSEFKDEASSRLNLDPEVIAEVIENAQDLEEAQAKGDEEAIQKEVMELVGSIAKLFTPGNEADGEAPAEGPTGGYDDAPVEDAPVEDAPVAEESAGYEPVAEEPVAEEPAAEEPAGYEPVAEEPVAEEPTGGSECEYMPAAGDEGAQPAETPTGGYDSAPIPEVTPPLGNPDAVAEVAQNANELVIAAITGDMEGVARELDELDQSVAKLRGDSEAEESDAPENVDSGKKEPAEV